MYVQAQAGGVLCFEQQLFGAAGASELDPKSDAEVAVCEAATHLKNLQASLQVGIPHLVDRYQCVGNKLRSSTAGHPPSIPGGSRAAELPP